MVGQCPCRDNVRGRACDECTDGFFNLTAGCQSCNCNTDGKQLAHTKYNYLYCGSMAITILILLLLYITLISWNRARLLVGIMYSIM